MVEIAIIYDNVVSCVVSFNLE